VTLGTLGCRAWPVPVGLKCATVGVTAVVPASVPVWGRSVELHVSRVHQGLVAWTATSRALRREL